MSAGRYRFDRFVLDPADRRLSRDGSPVELSARYFDALTLLVREAGRLVPKDRFLDEVWGGVPVTDEALTQGIKVLRRQLGDDAARPRFIETVPKHGYRFVAAVETIGADVKPLPSMGRGRSEVNLGGPRGGGVYPLPTLPHQGGGSSWRTLFLLGGAGTIGAGVAGAIGGLAYGFAAASGPAAPGTAGASVVLLLLWLTIAAALIGGAGVSFGIVIAGRAPGRHWMIAGGALGGLIVGGVVKLLGLDAFNLLFGQSPGDITGAPEGVLLGGAVGIGAWLAAGRSLRRGIALAALAGGAGGMVVALLGRRLMGGSLAALAGQLPHSRLRLDAIGGLFGENGFGPISQVVASGLEGMLFAGCVVGAIGLARRSRAGD